MSGSIFPCNLNWCKQKGSYIRCSWKEACLFAGTKKKASSFNTILIPLLILLGIGTLGLKKYEEMTATPVLTNKDVEQMKFNPVQSFRCEAGKTHCSHMSSCDEAKFYIKYCPDTQMDGDNDGIPCERQLCSW